MKKASSPPESNPAQAWNTRFSTEAYGFGTEPNEWLAGNGNIVDAFDISEVGIDKARRLAVDVKVSMNFTVAGCDEFLWRSDYCDGVAATFIQFAEPGLRGRIFQNIVRSLRPGGTLVLAGYTPKQLEHRTGGPRVLSHSYTETELREGEGHLGQSAVIGLVASRPLHVA